MKVQVTKLQPGDRVWHNGSTEMVASVVHDAEFSQTFTVTWSDGGRVIVRSSKTWDRVA